MSDLPRSCLYDMWPGRASADDAMAIVMLFNSPEVEIIGITTVFGNVPTKIATQNALHLVKPMV